MKIIFCENQLVCEILSLNIQNVYYNDLFLCLQLLGGHQIGIGTAPHGDLLATESTAWHLELHMTFICSPYYVCILFLTVW